MTNNTLKKTETENITYKYKDKEISTPTSEGYTIDFRRTKDWIEWLQKEFEISKDEFKTEQFKIQYKSKNQPKWDKLFYTGKEGDKKWGKLDEKTKFKIFFPPIYLHPLMEDGINFTHYCGWKQTFDVRKIKEHLKKKDGECFILTCGKCGVSWQGVGKECIYRVCEDHQDKKTSDWWKDAWKKLGVDKAVYTEKRIETGEKLWKV